MQHIETRRRRYRAPASIAVLACIVAAACADGNVEDNFSRSEDFTAISSNTNLSAPSDIGSATGVATFSGPGTLTATGFSASANTELVADFDNQTISGSMSDFTDGDARNFELRGQVNIFNGTITNGGAFTAQMAGNLERRPFFDTQTTPALTTFTGSSTGQIYDGLDGRQAATATGTITGTDTNGGGVTGSFAVQR